MKLLPYVIYLRPLTFVPTFFLALTGYAASPSRPAAVLPDLALLFVVQSVLLWGGANAFNSAEDLDEGPVNLLPHPPPVPPHLAAFGLAANGLAIALAALRGPRPAAIVLTASIVSVYYSWRGAPWRRGKEIGVIDNVVNGFGAGLGSILLGYTFTPAPLDARIVLVGLAFTLATFGGCPTSQIFQLSPRDTYATARNYTSLLGPSTTLRLGALLFFAHIVAVLVVTSPLGRVGVGSGVLLAGWALLALAGSAQALAWSRAPFDRPYLRMTRQFGTMMASPTLWTAWAWVATRG